MYQFMRDLIACRDWYDRDSGCILSRDDLCDIINFFWLLIDVCFLLLHVSFIFECLMYFFIHYSVLRVRFYNKIIIIIIDTHIAY